MLMLNDLQRHSLPERFLMHALAYVDAASKLTAELAKQPAGASFAGGAVTMYLALHSLELFLKGAILFVQPGESFKAEGHDIERLESRYHNLFPAKALRFDMPFRSEVAQLVEPDPDLERALTEQLAALRKRAPEDQFLRYPADRRGVAWEDVEPMARGYEPTLFLVTLRRLRADYERIGTLLRQAGASEGAGGANS